MGIQGLGILPKLAAGKSEGWPHFPLLRNGVPPMSSMRAHSNSRTNISNGYHWWGAYTVPYRNS